ncbi:hypothetical protein [Fibrobacter sp. UWH1]|uniref:hypothetical protein n=1 Tax=Fibrobacter sp. UWH1 TaxID=1964354 RepID=UPI000B5249A6|nr:hypothetical protein [Fibrobacter sp. UWH1]OWV13547.1 hypothetical protein B7992_08300 [Fibrobacter sp. UWH1]
MLSKQLKNIVDILHDMDKKAALFLSNQNYDDALAVYKEILKAQEQLKLEKLCGHTMLNIANIYMMQNDYDQALANISKAAMLKSMQSDNDDRGNLKLTQASCLFVMNKGKVAESELKNELRKNSNKTLCGKIELLLFSYYKDVQNRLAARTFIDKAINHFKLDHNKEELLRALKGRVDYFRSIGQGHYAQFDESEIERLMNS